MFRILSIASNEITGDEQLGSKPKFWFARGEEQWLFKEAREHTGEDWAEKIASEIAFLVGISAAHVDLAEYMGRRGCASRSFVHTQTDALVHGNELLGVIIGYDLNKKLRQSDHTLSNIIAAMRKLFPEHRQIQDRILKKLASYVVFDALIANTDRHHENWGLLFQLQSNDPSSTRVHIEAAPSFDHASSLGRELRDERRIQILNSRNRGIDHYIRNGRGGIYVRAEDRRGANPLNLVEVGARNHPDYFAEALIAVANTPLERMLAVIDEVPNGRMSATARDFTRSLLTYTHNTLTKLAHEISISSVART